MPNLHRLTPVPIRFAKSALVVILALSVAVAAGDDSRPTIGVSLMTLAQNDFFGQMLAGMRRAASSQSLELAAHDSEYSQEIQNKGIDLLVAKRVKLIIVSPIDSRSVIPALERADAAGIPVITVDSDSTWPGVLCNVSSDNTAGGRLAAGLMLEYLAERGISHGDILMLNHEGATSTENRLKGFSDVMRLRGKGFRLRSLNATGMEAPARAITVYNLALPKSNTVAIFGSNASMTLGALRAINETGRTGKIVVIGYDLNKETRQAVDEGLIGGVVAQFPEQIGEIAIRFAGASIFAGDRRFERHSLIEVGIYTGDGMLDQRGKPMRK